MEGSIVTIQINKPELEALIRERLQAGNFRNVEDMLLHALGGDTPKETPSVPHVSKRRLEKEADVWVLHTGQPLPPTIVEDTLNAIRQERNFGNLRMLR